MKILLIYQMRILLLSNENSVNSLKENTGQTDFVNSFNLRIIYVKFLDYNPLTANLTKWSNTLKKFVGKSR